MYVPNVLEGVSAVVAALPVAMIAGAERKPVQVSDRGRRMGTLAVLAVLTAGPVPSSTGRAAGARGKRSILPPAGVLKHQSPHILRNDIRVWETTRSSGSVLSG